MKLFFNAKKNKNNSTINRQARLKVPVTYFASPINPTEPCTPHIKQQKKKEN
jgi:hypothetical protein